MKLTVILGLLLVLLVLTDFTDAQRRRNRGRRRGRGRRGRNQCHLKEVEKCFDKLQSLGKGPEPSEIIATGKGLDKLCSTIRQDTIRCAKNYMKKCGTPLHREIFNLFLDSITINFKLYCDPGPSREAFLKQSPCMHNKVLSQNDYKVGCNNDYLASLEATEVDDVDESLDIMCCGYNRWEQCAIGKISNSCGAKGKEEFEKFVSKMLGGMTRRVCPVDLFDPTSSSCTKVLPALGTKPKGQKSDNAISKYVTSYGSFLFSLGQ